MKQLLQYMNSFTYLFSLQYYLTSNYNMLSSIAKASGECNDCQIFIGIIVSQIYFENSKSYRMRFRCVPFLNYIIHHWHSLDFNASYIWAPLYLSTFFSFVVSNGSCRCMLDKVITCEETGSQFTCISEIATCIAVFMIETI